MKTMDDVVAAYSVDEDLAENDNSGGKEVGHKTLRSLKRGLGKLWRRHRGNASITEYDPSYKVAYLGNVLTGWAKGEGCVEKPVSTLWRNYVSSNRPDVTMRLTVTNGGLTATTKDHGVTEYWAHRVTYCTAPTSHPRLFVWVYRHEGRRLRPELRCHAALCSKESTARRLASTLNTRLHQALLEFRRDKVSRQNARLSLANAVYDNPSLPRRKILLSTGGQNYRPPLERSKSAPKLSAIEEDAVAEEIEQKRLLDELRSFENVARSWRDHDRWRLARLIDSLNRTTTGTSSEYFDENASISSGCETASISNSEERTSPSDDANHIITVESNQALGGPRRNSEGSPNFLTCTGSPRFHRGRKRSSRMDPEDEDDSIQSSNVFDFEDPEVYDEVVDYRPHGESLSPTSIARRISPTNETFEGEKGPSLLITLDSLDEEEPDSDESGYVEAPPKSLLAQEQTSTDVFSNNTQINDNDQSHTQGNSNVSSLNYESPESYKNKVDDSSSTDNFSTLKMKEREKVDFIKCPISETIKKLANASLRSSKSLDISNSSCLKAFNTLKNSKSFDGTKVVTTDCDGESPSLYQRKQLLAQHGVTV